MFRATPGALLVLVAGCAAPPPETRRLDPDAVIEDIATEVTSDAVYGELPTADASMTACFMDGEILPRARARVLDLSGRTYSFCSPACCDAFEREPGRWIGAARHKPAAPTVTSGPAEPVTAQK